MSSDEVLSAEEIELVPAIPGDPAYLRRKGGGAMLPAEEIYATLAERDARIEELEGHVHRLNSFDLPQEVVDLRTQLAKFHEDSEPCPSCAEIERLRACLREIDAGLEPTALDECEHEDTSECPWAENHAMHDKIRAALGEGK